jgi:hypothetical protein
LYKCIEIEPELDHRDEADVANALQISVSMSCNEFEDAPLQTLHDLFIQTPTPQSPVATRAEVSKNLVDSFAPRLYCHHSQRPASAFGDDEVPNVNGCICTICTCAKGPIRRGLTAEPLPVEKATSERHRDVKTSQTAPVKDHRLTDSGHVEMSQQAAALTVEGPEAPLFDDLLDEGATFLGNAGAHGADAALVGLAEDPMTRASFNALLAAFRDAPCVQAHRSVALLATMQQCGSLVLFLMDQSYP